VKVGLQTSYSRRRSLTWEPPIAIGLIKAGGQIQLIGLGIKRPGNLRPSAGVLVILGLVKAAFPAAASATTNEQSTDPDGQRLKRLYDCFVAGMLHDGFPFVQSGNEA